MRRVSQWVEHWITEARGAALSTGAVALAVQEAVLARHLPLPKVTILGESGVIGVLLQQRPTGEMTVSIGTGAVRGELVVEPPTSREKGRLVFDVEAVHGEWEPFYRLFVDVARSLGARLDFRRPLFVDVDALTETLRQRLDGCVSDCLFAEGLATYALDLSVQLHGDERAGNALALRVQRGEGTVEVDLIAPGLLVGATLGGDSARLSASGLDVLESALLADWTAPIEAAVATLRRGAPPPADVGRPGRVVAFVREDDDFINEVDDSAFETVAALFAHHLPERDVEVVRYFNDGQPFWKASLAAGSPLPPLLPDDDLDALYAHRTWQWAPEPLRSVGLVSRARNRRNLSPPPRRHRHHDNREHDSREHIDRVVKTQEHGGSQQRARHG
jgi:hypothetical protein